MVWVLTDSITPSCGVDTTDLITPFHVMDAAGSITDSHVAGTTDPITALIAFEPISNPTKAKEGGGPR